MSSVYLQNGEVITSNGSSLECTLSSLLNNKSNLKSMFLKKSLNNFTVGLADWTNLEIQYNQKNYRRKLVLTILFKKLLPTLKIRKIDRVICQIAPRPSDLDWHIKNNKKVTENIDENDISIKIIEQFKLHNFLISDDQIDFLDNTCTSGHSLLGFAYQGIKLNKWNNVVLIAIDLVDEINLHILNNLGALATSNLSDDAKSRPFDKNRSGFIKSDGAAIALLTSNPEYENNNLCEILSFSQTNDAYKLTDGRDDTEGIQKAMKLAIERSGITIDNIDIIKTHGTSTILNDLHESNAIQKVFENLNPFVTSLKGHLGHTTDASGLVENIVFSAALKKGYYLGIKNLDRPAFNLNFLKNVKQIESSKNIFFLCNNLGFGGNNSCLVLKSNYIKEV